ncbi:ABC transporter permease [Candidatus Woesearchaeota archaeon]|nr:ABC transporter permease [Candidatus Woesearchaeota archaeon]
MSPLWLLTTKNLKLLIRSRSSALIVVFAPLLIILILGLSFNNSAKYGLNIGVYASSYNNDVNSFINTLQEQEFKIIKYNNSVTECIEDIKLGYVHTCILLPDSFKIESNSPREITYYVDPSRINLVWMIQQMLEKKLNLQSQEISQQLAQELLTKLSSANTKVATEKNKITEVKQKSDTATSVTDTTKSALSKLDLTPPLAEYGFNVTNEFKDAVVANLNLGTIKIAAAKSAVSSANMSSSDKAVIKNLLSEAGAGLVNISGLMSATSGTASFGAVSSLVTSLQADITTAKEKLTTAKQQVATTSKDLDTVKASIGEVVASLEGIQKALDEVNANLNSQKITEAKVFSSPLVTKIERVAPENTYLNYMFPALIVLVIMFSSLLLGTTLVMMEKNSPAFTRNFFLPVKKVTFVLATYLTNLFLILVQVIIILGISVLFLKEIYAALLPLALILFLAASVFTFLGMAIGYLFSSEETAVLASISAGSILLFVSGTILPLESVSPTLRDITFLNPFVIGEKLVREILIFNTPIMGLWMDLAVFFSYTLVLFLIILIIESLMHQRIVNRIFHHHKMQREKDKIEKKDV